MNRNKGAKKRQVTIPVWTFVEAQRVLPYLTSIMRTIREAHLDAQYNDRQVRRLAALPGRPDRQHLIAHEEASRETQRAKDRFQEAATELEAMSIFCLNPVRGEAFIPFAHEDQLAWFVFDLFDPEALRAWRLHTDPLDERRPIAEILAPTPQTPKAA